MSFILLLSYHLKQEHRDTHKSACACLQEIKKKQKTGTQIEPKDPETLGYSTFNLLFPPFKTNFKIH